MESAPRPPVLVEPACLHSLVTSAVEVYNRETTGLLVGRERLRTVRGRRRRVVALEAAYPFQTAARKVTWVEPGNHAALDRARSSTHTLGFRILGEYHSHTNNEQALSHADVEYAAEALRTMNGTAPKTWLELVLGMRRRSYARPRTAGLCWRPRGARLACTVMLGPTEGFEITFAGYWLSPNGGEEMRCEAARLLAPKG